MKPKPIAFARRYGAALRKYLRPGPCAGLQPALALGRQAAALDLDTLDVARIHEAALATLEPSRKRGGLLKQAGRFFAEAVTPIEKRHRAGLKAMVRLSRLSQALGQRTADLAASHRSLAQGVVQRKTVERALKKSGERSRRLLRGSRDLQARLRRRTHQILSAQEGERKKVSRDLHDEIGQSLLGIHVRLVTLKKEAAVNAHGLKREIRSTQRLVDASAKNIGQFASELGIHRGK